MQKKIWNSIMKMRKHYSEQAKQRVKYFRIEKIVKEWKEILR